MNYYNLQDKNHRVDFGTAVVQGLAPNNGLYMPSEIPVLDIWHDLPNLSPVEIGTAMLRPFVTPSLDEATLKRVVSETLSFDIPVVQVAENRHCLELFHGPTQAFKDVGARFMSRCLAAFRHDKSQPVTVLTATSGDTGSAVANGFYQVDGVQVKILFPKGGVSAYQEHQMTSLGGNIQAFEVDGTFDDCQALVKSALSDEALRADVALSSANSINVARLLPQMIYYALGLRQLMQQGLTNHDVNKVVFSVPSGNFGNLTAGVLAYKMGLPVKRFIAACNENDAVCRYLQTGEYAAKASVATVANAMDVGNPSNFVRLSRLCADDVVKLRQVLLAVRYDDDAIIETMQATYEKTGYVLDPHGATGYQSLLDGLHEDEIGVFLGTAAPIKFLDVVQRAIPDYQGIEVDLSSCHKTQLTNDYQTFKKCLL